MLTKDGIYCSYLKWICSSTEKYHKTHTIIQGIAKWNSTGLENPSSSFILNVNCRIEIEF